MGDKGIRHLKPLTWLRSLHLLGTGVSDAGLRHLAAFKGLTQLILDIDNVSSEGIRIIRTALPALDVSLLSPDRVYERGEDELEGYP